MPSHRMRVAAAVLVAAVAAPLHAQVLPAGTTVRIRFLDRVESGRAPVHGAVRAQTLGPLAVTGCVAVPPYVPLAGTIATSRAGRTALGRGSLRIEFDSVEARPGRWIGFHALLDSLEWSPRRVREGTAFSGRHSIVALAAEQLALLAADLAAAPAAGLEAAHLAAKHERVTILPGEEAVVRTAAPIVLPPGFPCARPEAPAGLVALPFPLAARTASADGTIPGDPVNVLFLGSGAELERALAGADWVVAYRSSAGHLAREVVDALAQRPDPRAPVSRQSYGGREEDLAFERAGPSARRRHHVRFWRTGEELEGDTVWVGAATQDVGLRVKPTRTPTHRIDPRVDLERELLVRELLAGGCARLEGYVQLPGAVAAGVNAEGQRFRTDGLAAMVRGWACGASVEGP